MLYSSTCQQPGESQSLLYPLQTAPYIFNLFAEVLHWIIQWHIPAAIQHYLDDFLPIFHPSTPFHVADVAVTWIQELGAQLGLQFHECKTVCPCMALEFLGLELDSLRMEACLPMLKLCFLCELLMTWGQKCTCLLHELHKLVGFLQFALQVIPASHTFIRRLIDFSMSFTCQITKQHIPAAAHADLAWWSTYAESWNGVHLLQQAHPTLHVHTDASGTKGIGSTFGANWYTLLHSVTLHAFADASHAVFPWSSVAGIAPPRLSASSAPSSVHGYWFTWLLFPFG